MRLDLRYVIGSIQIRYKVQDMVLLEVPFIAFINVKLVHISYAGNMINQPLSHLKVMFCFHKKLEKISTPTTSNIPFDVGIDKSGHRQFLNKREIICHNNFKMNKIFINFFMLKKKFT